MTTTHATYHMPRNGWSVAPKPEITSAASVTIPTARFAATDPSRRPT